MNGFSDGVRARAALASRIVVFPEPHDERVRDAVRELALSRIVTPVLIRGAETRGATDVPGVETVDASADPRRGAAAAHLAVRRAGRGLTGAAAEATVGNALWFADYLVASGEADGCVSGAATNTADVLRAALWTVGPADGVRTVSSAFYMELSVPTVTGERVLTFTDCAVVPEPTPEQLADIAVAAAADRRRIVGDEPRVALLSFGTRGSARSPRVDQVTAALAIARARAPDLAIDGELQADAALDPVVAARKLVVGSVAGRANVLVFPSLEAGNIAYKLAQELAGAAAVGPVIQGLKQPCNDLSRGARISDIVTVAAITALQASGLPNHRDGHSPLGDSE